MKHHKNLYKINKNSPAGLFFYLFLKNFAQNLFKFLYIFLFYVIFTEFLLKNYKNFVYFAENLRELVILHKNLYKFLCNFTIDKHLAGSRRYDATRSALHGLICDFSRGCSNFNQFPPIPAI